MLVRVVVVALAVLVAAVAYLAVQVGAGPRPTEVGDGPRASAAPHPEAALATHHAAEAPTPSAQPTPEAGARAAAGPGTSQPQPPPPPQPQPQATPPAPTAGDFVPGANLSFDEANKLYDRHDYEEARSLALTLLRQYPASVRMRRIVVASSCIMGDLEPAQQHYLMLAERDRADMRARCTPYGLSFHE